MRSPRGLSLIELILVLAITGIAAGAITRIATHQQRRYTTLAASSLAHAQLRDGLAVLSTQLAGISPSAGDIYEGGMGSASIEFRSPLATALLCEAPIDGATEVDVVALASVADTGAGDRDAVAGDPIAAGDSVWLHDARSDTVDAEPGTAWRAHIVTSAAGIRRPCGALGDGREWPATHVTLSPAVSGVREPHAPARFYRRTRYALYRAADDRSYLGFADCRPLVRTPACSPLQPVAGPYLPDAAPSAPRAPGLRFEYLDASGQPTADRLAVVAIVVELRANGALAGLPVDTLLATGTIAFRNATR